MSTSTTCWSAENATKAYLTTLRMCERGREPDVAEFVSALAAGNNSQLMVIAGGTSPHSTAQALVAAGHQTGGRVICILPTLQASQNLLGLMGLGFNNGPKIEFVVGDPKRLLTTQYDNADFVLVDCSLHNHHDILSAVVSNNNKQNGNIVVVGYNYKERSGLSSLSYGVKTQFLPIGKGLLVTRFGGKKKNEMMMRKKSKWIVKVDKCTGEEHVFRVRFPQAKVIHV